MRLIFFHTKVPIGEAPIDSNWLASVPSVEIESARNFREFKPQDKASWGRKYYFSKADVTNPPDDLSEVFAIRIREFSNTNGCYCGELASIPKRMATPKPLTKPYERRKLIESLRSGCYVALLKTEKVGDTPSIIGCVQLTPKINGYYQGYVFSIKVNGKYIYYCLTSFQLSSDDPTNCYWMAKRVPRLLKAQCRCQGGKSHYYRWPATKSQWVNRKETNYGKNAPANYDTLIESEKRLYENLLFHTSVECLKSQAEYTLLQVPDKFKRIV